MVTFDPVITIGPIIVWVTIVVLFLIVMARLSKEVRRAALVDAKLEILQDQVDQLKRVIAGDGRDDDAWTS